MFWYALASLARPLFTRPMHRKEDYTFDRSTMQSVRAASCEGKALPPVFFLLTSTPNRAARLPVVLELMRSQSHRPSGVVLTIPKVFARFNQSYQLPDAATWPELRVNRIADDPGPISKYMGSFALPAESIVIVGDDDMAYGRTFIEDFACAVASHPADLAFSAVIDGSCGAIGGCVMGFRGVALRAGMLRDVQQLGTVLARAGAPRACFLSDDVAISYFLKKMKGYHLRKLVRLRSRTSVDKGTSFLNGSLNLIHKRHNFELNRGCAHALLSDASSQLHSRASSR